MMNNENCSDISLRYHDITTEDMKNGDGLRTVLWLAGCEHHCPECQNPITWDRFGGIPFDKAAEDELMESLKPDYVSGITFSGGDPLATYNRPGVAKLIAKIKRTGTKIHLDLYRLHMGTAAAPVKNRARPRPDVYYSESGCHCGRPV